MISKENALRSVLQFVGSDVGLDLTEEQGEELAMRLMHRVKVDIVMQPEAVLSHATALFPPPDPDYVRRTTPLQQPKQSREQAIAVITDFLNNGWHLVAPGCLLPTVSKINHKLFFDGVNASANRNGFVRRDHLADIAGGLFQRGLLEKAAAPAEPPPPPLPPPSARDLHNAQVARSRAMNDPSTSPLKGAREKAAPLVSEPKSVLTEEQRVALNEKKRAEDSTIAEAVSRVNGYSSYSHSRTFSGRAQLREVFQASMDAGKSAADVLAAVVAKIDALTDNGSIR